jgi:hypothetical protein
VEKLKYFGTAVKIRVIFVRKLREGLNWSNACYYLGHSLLFFLLLSKNIDININIKYRELSIYL